MNDKTRYLYIAGSWEDRDEINALMHRFDDIPEYEIATFWTEQEAGNREHMQMCAIQDLNGVRSCDIFIIHDPHKASKGKYTELGYAMGMGKPIITYKTKWRGIFTYSHPARHANNFDELLKVLNEV